MKRAILFCSAALIILTSLVIPTATKFDGGVGTTGCGMTLCKPK